MFLKVIVYDNVGYYPVYLNYSDRLACTNSVNPDQTVTEGNVYSGFAVFCHSFTLFTYDDNYCEGGIEVSEYL